MRLETGIRAGKESLMTHGTALNTIGDNLANVNTTGFKDSRLEFADLFNSGGGNIFGGPIRTGNGVSSAGITSMHRTQGTLIPTNRSLDAAIEGRGWFAVADGEDVLYTRAGNFSSDADGFLVTQSGLQVLGFTEEGQEEPVPINVNGIAGEPEASANLSIAGNLNGQAPLVEEIPGEGATFQELNQAATFTTSTTVIDSLGAEQTVNLYFYKTDDLTWDVQAVADGASVGGEEGAPAILGAAQFQVGPNGLQEEGAENVLEINPAWGDGAEAGNIAVDLSQLSGFAGQSFVSSITSDGLQGGNVDSISITDDGNVAAFLSSGESINVAQLSLALFNSPENLERVGNNFFRANELTGEANVGRVGTEGRGNVVGQALENSTVDTAKEFVTLVQYQQGYRAGSQVIQTLSELMSSTIQIA